MYSMTLEEAKKRVDGFNNQHLFNFIKQRQCQSEPSELLNYAYEVANNRLMKEHSILQSIIDRSITDEA